MEAETIKCGELVLKTWEETLTDYFTKHQHQQPSTILGLSPTPWPLVSGQFYAMTHESKARQEADFSSREKFPGMASDFDFSGRTFPHYSPAFQFTCCESIVGKMLGHTLSTNYHLFLGIDH